MRSFACSVLLSAVLLVPLAGCADDAETIPDTTGGAAGTSVGGSGGASGKSGSSGHTTAGKSGSSGSTSGSSGVGGGPGGAGGAGQGGTSAGGAGSSGAGAAGSSGANAGGTSAGANAGGTSAGANAGGSEGPGGAGAGVGGTDAGGTDGGAGAGESGAGGANAAGTDGGGGSGGAGESGASGQAGAAGQGGTDAGGAGQGGSAGAAGGSGGSGQGGGPGERLRIMASNLSSGTKQSYEDPGPGLRILQGVHPDVVLVQEFNYGANNAAAWATMTTKVLGEPGFYYHETAGQIPNGVISRYPIIESGSWDDKLATDREFAWARIDIPGSRNLWAVSVHLLTKSETVRNNQAKELLDFFAQKVPAEDYLVLGGDFNTDVRTETALTTFATKLVVGPEFPVDMGGNGNTSVKRNKPYDWVLGTSDLDKLEIPVQLGANLFPHGFVADTKSYSPIADLAPALPTDSLDTVNGKPTYMQHLGVVRDFWIPTDSAQP